MHDITEGGLVATLNEIAHSSNVGFSVNYTNLPITSDLITLVNHFKLSQNQVLSISSTGNILAAVSPAKKDEIVNVLSKRGLNTKIIGMFSKNKERFLECDGSKRIFPRFIDDPYARILN
jgi:hydrogenase expression/formation protein HypE